MNDLMILSSEMDRFESENGLTQTAKRASSDRYDWDMMWVQVCKLIHDNGVPGTQSELVNEITDIFIRRNADAPDESTIRRRIGPLWRELRSPD